MGPFGKGLRPLYDKLARIKGYPLATRETVTVLAVDPRRGRFKRTLTETSTAKEMAQTPLDQNLFVVPTSYREIVPDKDMMPRDWGWTLAN